MSHFVWIWGSTTYEEDLGRSYTIFRRRRHVSEDFFRISVVWKCLSSRDSNLVTGSRISRDWANPESRGIMRARFSRFSGLILLFFKDFMTVLGVNLLLKKWWCIERLGDLWVLAPWECPFFLCFDLISNHQMNIPLLTMSCCQNLKVMSGTSMFNRK